jgi:glycosyltransferase involved in cell wall biosynthesis
VQRLFIARSAAMLATGTPAMENYQQLGVEASKLRNFPFVVDPEHFEKAIELRRARSNSAHTTFVLPARLRDDLKGQSIAIQALARAKSEAPDHKLRLILAGTGPDEAKLRTLVESLGLANEVEFRGWVEYNDMPALLGEADVLLLPSRWDPFPVAILEAMAAGLPVLASAACGSARDRIVAGENGFIHTVGDMETLASHVKSLASSPNLRENMGASALQTSRQWGIDHAASVLNSLLQS